jgi:hypothetical protein
MLEYVVYRTTGLEYIFQLLLPKMSVEANVRRFLRHSLVCATRLWGTLTGLGALKLCKGATAKKPTCMDPEQKTKTYNRRDSQMVTHSSTSRPVQCLCMAERTGCPVLTDLWSYVPSEIICSIPLLDDREME